MGEAHTARVYWSEEQLTLGLPVVHQTVDPAWLMTPGRGSEHGWSLRCEFPSPPSVQGSPSLARVSFVLAEAPHERLCAGTWLELFERWSRQHARVEILD